jgi:hypothetical protein
MDLIDRYVIAVRRQLPRGLADDITAELADSLRSEAEEYQRATGHAITEAEQSALLKKRGHPWLMASRYQPQQYLIGPALFPYYKQALQIVVFWVVVPLVLFGAALNAIYTNDPGVSASVQAFVRGLGSAWNGAIYAIGMVTIVFAILDHEKVRINVLDHWSPAKLPEPTEGRIIPRAETIIGLVFTLTFLVWWIGLVRVPELVLRPGDGVEFAPAPIWTTLYLPILVCAIAGAGVYFIDLVRPWRTVTVSIVDMIVNAASIVILVAILRADQYVIVSGPGVLAGNIDRAYWVNQVVEWSLMVVTAIAIFDLCYELWRVRKTRGSAALV